MSSQHELGKTGEQMAINLLREKGYEILEKNWRSGKLEVDIICRKNDQMVFVEVKTRSSDFDLEELIPPSKEASLIQAVNVYLEALEDEVESRIDLIVLEFQNGELHIEHMENAIDPW